MNNYLDLALRDTALPIGGDGSDDRLAGAPRLSASVPADLPASVKAAFVHSPLNRPEDITGRWRPVWTEEGADALA